MRLQMRLIPIVAALMLGHAAALAQDMTKSDYTTKVSPPHLIIEFDGNNARERMIEFLIKLWHSFGEGAFPTQPYEVTKNDTLCAIYEQFTNLPVNRTACPKSVEDLGRAINPETKGIIRTGQVIDLPVFEVKLYRTELAIPQNYIAHFSDYVVSKQKEGNDYIAQKVTYVARIPTSPLVAKGVVSMLGRSPTPGIVAFTSDAGMGVEKIRQDANWLAPNGVVSVCADVARPEDDESSFYYLFDWLKNSKWHPSDKIRQCALNCRAANSDSAGACADLVLLDAPIQQHKDIHGVVQSLDRAGQPLPLGDLVSADYCTVDDNLADTDHGTHLASIIASKDDGTGFVGMSPGLDVFAYPWDKNTTFPQLLKLIKMRTNTQPSQGETFFDRGPQVFVFASHFPAPGRANEPYSYGREYMKDSQLNQLKENSLAWVSNALSKAVVNSHPSSIWVVAAMQKGKGLDLVEQVSDKLGFSPINLGNFHNVIGVSVCENCKDGDASLWPDAFWGKRFVHVAAPAMSVLAPVGPGRLVRGGGTSQATALVGGLVAAMINCYGDSYTVPPSNFLNSSYVKQRLQITARPIFYRDEDLERIASGVIDPRAALLDPSETWILKTGSEEYTKLAAASAHWCDEQLVLVDSTGEPITLHTQNVYRLFRMTKPIDGGGEQKLWVVYARGLRIEEEENDTRTDVPVDRYDPRRLVSPQASANLIKLPNGEYLRAKDFQDLILSKPLNSRSCI